MNNKNDIIDRYEIYSFSVYLYFYGFFFLYIFEQKLLIAILSTIFSNILFSYLFKYNFISLLCHKYWKNNLNSIAMPQLLSCLSNIMIYNNTFINSNKYMYVVLIPSNILFYYLINIIYKKEIIQSKNLRFIIGMLFFIIKFIF
jgi:hypothetical protein